jgi:hypothetical protein
LEQFPQPYDGLGLRVVVAVLHILFEVLHYNSRYIIIIYSLYPEVHIA